MGDIGNQGKKQVDGICKMLALEATLTGCFEDALDEKAVIKELQELLREYPSHQMTFNLVRSSIGYYLDKGQMDIARRIASEFASYYENKSQISKFLLEEVIELLDGIETDTLNVLQNMERWNTPDQDEFGLSSWGDGSEVFFVRRDPKTMKGNIMTSKFKNDEWSSPVVVKALSIKDDIEPLYITPEGLRMLLRSGSEILESSRWGVGGSWSRPNIKLMPKLNTFLKRRMSGFATATPEGMAILFEAYDKEPEALLKPKKKIYFSGIEEESDSKHKSLSKKLDNIGDYDYSNPRIALDGRMLFFTSDRPGGFGGMDMYSAKLGKAYDWNTLQEPVNLGVPMNTFGDDEGVTFFSEQSGETYFSRRDRCNGVLNIWRMAKINTPEVFSENTMRFAGMVLDQNKVPISKKGFMEFAFGQDSLSGIEYKNIGENGVYQYTGPDSMKVIRLFPEIPGYYSERDTLHFLSNAKDAGIIRDTFIVYDFDYIRRTFKLERSTFFNGQAEFDNPDKTYPELVRLAKIATRMSAQLHLIGHTDNTGEGTSNLELSLQRANAVKAFLVKRCGFPEDRIKTEGVGSKMPLCTNDSEECRRKNRRVEVTFLMPNLLDDGLDSID